VPVYAGTVLLNWSFAVTEMLETSPAAIGLARPVTERNAVAAGCTVTVWLPVVALIAMSVTVTERLPAVRRVTPFVNV
jgi:hypothetical protein